MNGKNEVHLCLIETITDIDKDQTPSSDNCAL
jgi:hypothetical protein